MYAIIWSHLHKNFLGTKNKKANKQTKTKTQKGKCKTN